MVAASCYFHMHACSWHALVCTIYTSATGLCCSRSPALPCRCCRAMLPAGPFCLCRLCSSRSLRSSTASHSACVPGHTPGVTCLPPQE